MGAGAQIAGWALLFMLTGFMLAWSLCRIAAWSVRATDRPVAETTVDPVSREILAGNVGPFISGPFRLCLKPRRLPSLADAPAFLMRGNFCLGSVTRSAPDGLWRAVICRGRPMREIPLGRFDRRSDAMAALWEARHHEPIDGSGN